MRKKNIRCLDTGIEQLVTKEAPGMGGDTASLQHLWKLIFVKLNLYKSNV